MIHAPKLLAFDLDGTLLTHDKRISPRNAAALKAARAAGVHVTIASGRMHEATGRYAKQLGLPLDTLIVSYNGARVGPIEGAATYECPVDACLAQYLIDYTEAHKLPLNFYYDDVLYVRELNEWTDLYERRTGSVPNPIGSFERFRGVAPTKLLIINSLEVTNSLVAPMKEHYGDSLYITKTDDEYLEFMNPAANKGAALADVASSLGIARENCVAFGDNYNDLPMLEWAGWSVGMGNGKAEVKAVASEVAPDAQQDGVGQIVERMIADLEAREPALA
ncbi:MAG TPA: Cof-type HAD-IIB family hydrolase [Capsulimonadaceae bacterium]|jgi:hypothetical protein